MWYWTCLWLCAASRLNANMSCAISMLVYKHGNLRQFHSNLDTGSEMHRYTCMLTWDDWITSNMFTFFFFRFLGVIQNFQLHRFTIQKLVPRKLGRFRCFRLWRWSWWKWCLQNVGWQWICQWKIHHLKIYFQLKMGIFNHCHVGLPGGAYFLQIFTNQLRNCELRSLLPTLRCPNQDSSNLKGFEKWSVIFLKVLRSDGKGVEPE